ncbi:hypothetical protein M3Y95_00797800 [Aphelenchoides besseyi]|nr:hypothetical protein M3Y95_00797800 [Aphelenchoides besseyi]
MSSSQTNLSNHQTIDEHQVKLVDLPFYKRHWTLLRESVRANGNQNEVQSQSFRFSIPQTYLSEFVLNENDPFSIYKIHLRMGLLDTSKEQQDKYPKNVSGNINDTTIKFPSIDEFHKEVLRPVDISLACLPMRDEYELNIKWQSDGANYFVGVYIVKHLTPQLLHVQIRNNDRYYLKETRQMIRKIFEESDQDDVKLDSLTVSLLCPLSRTFMSVPSRSRDCSHLQCFDLLNYLKMNEQRPTWKCPICCNSSPYDSLVIDVYFYNIIIRVKGAATCVELLPNTDYKIVKEKERQYLDAHGLPVEIQQTKNTSENNSSAASGSKNQGGDLSKSNRRLSLHVITLDDSSSSEPEIENETIDKDEATLALGFLSLNSYD